MKKNEYKQKGLLLLFINRVPIMNPFIDHIEGI